MGKSDAGYLSQSQIDSFAEKLAQFAETLPESQRSIAKLFAEQALGLTPARVALAGVSADFKKSVKAVLADLSHIAGGPWVRADPVWERKNKIELETEEIAYVQTLFVRQRIR